MTDFLKIHVTNLEKQIMLKDDQIEIYKDIVNILRVEVKGLEIAVFQARGMKESRND